MPPNGGGGLGNAPSGATLVRVHVPWGAASAGLGGSARAQSLTSIPFSTPTPFATPTPLAASPGPTAYPAQALTITVNASSPVTQTAGLTPLSPGCAPATAGGTVCQLALPLAPGTYTASVATYGSSAATPSTLTAPAQTIAFTVVAGGSNVVNLSIGAPPASLDVVPASAFANENAAGGIDLYGGGKHQLIAELLDANQNVVVGAGMPGFAIAQIGGSLTLGLTQPAEGGPSNLFLVAPPPAYSSGTATLRVTPNLSSQANNPCVAGATACSGTVTFDEKQLLAVANSSANSVTFYAGGQVLPIAAIQNGLTDPQGLVFDAAGDVFVANQPGSIAEFSAPYSGLPTTIGVGVNHPQALAVDARGDLFVANGNGSNTVTEYAPPYTGGPTVTISNGVNDPVSLGLDGTGNLFVVNQAANSVTIYAPPYNDAPISVSNGLNGPNSVAIDARGNAFVSNLNSTPNSVVEFSPPFSGSSAPVSWITNGVNEQGAIGLGPSANLFVPNQGANTVTEYAAPYAGSPTVISGGQSQPVAIAVDGTGVLYVANYGNNTVTQYAPPYSGVNWTTLSNGISNPQALALSPSTSAAGGIVP